MTDIHRVVPEPSEDIITMIQEKMYAFIFPNHPCTQDEIAAFEQAVMFQYTHEASRAMEQQEDIPNGVQSFSLGDFSMTFDKSFWDSRLNRKTICPSAYGVLLRHGLLYRGVEGRR